MSTISFGGLASGLDTDSIVQALLELRRAPITRMQARRNLEEKRLEALDELKTKLNALRSAAQAMDTVSEFQSKSATSSVEGVVSATVESAAPLGSFTITVDQLATTHRVVSDVYASTSDDVGTGTFSFTVGGVTTDVTLTAGASSLADLRDGINNAQAGVTAAIIDDGTGYRLMISADETGTAGAFTTDTSGLSGGTAPTLSVNSTGADAQFSIDGIAITSSSNTVVNPIEGLTLELGSVGTSTVNVISDVSGIVEKFEAYKDAYNDVIEYMDEKGAEGGPLESSQLVRSLRRRLSSTSIQSVATGGDYTITSSVGLEFDRYGKMSFDQDKLADAIDKDYQSVLALFTRNVSETDRGIAVDMAAEIDLYTKSTDGIIQARKDGINDRIEDFDRAILRDEESLEKYELFLTRKFTHLEMTMARLQAQSGFLQAS